MWIHHHINSPLVFVLRIKISKQFPRLTLNQLSKTICNSLCVIKTKHSNAVSYFRVVSIAYFISWPGESGSSISEVQNSGSQSGSRGNEKGMRRGKGRRGSKLQNRNNFQTHVEVSLFCLPSSYCGPISLSNLVSRITYTVIVEEVYRKIYSLSWSLRSLGDGWKVCERGGMESRKICRLILT